MSNIKLLILFNIIIIFLSFQFKNNIIIVYPFIFILLISMFIKLIYKKNIEGNFYDKDSEIFSFWDRLNDETPLEEENSINNIVLNKINQFISLIMEVEKKGEEEYDKIKCEGRFVKKASKKKCGYNAYNEKVYEITKPGINCDHRDGYSERDFLPRCRLDEKCDSDRDCEKGKCHRGKCQIEFGCSPHKLDNCKESECDKLNEHVGIDKYAFKDGKCKSNSCNADQFYNCDEEGCMNLGYKFQWYDNGTERDIEDDRCIIRDLEEQPPRCNSLDREICKTNDTCEWCPDNTCKNIGGCLPGPAPPPASCEEKNIGTCTTTDEENCNNTYEFLDNNTRYLCELTNGSCVRTDTECIEVTPLPGPPPPPECSDFDGEEEECEGTEGCNYCLGNCFESELPGDCPTSCSGVPLDNDNNCKYAYCKYCPKSEKCYNASNEGECPPPCEKRSLKNCYKFNVKLDAPPPDGRDQRLVDNGFEMDDCAIANGGYLGTEDKCMEVCTPKSLRGGGMSCNNNEFDKTCIYLGFENYPLIGDNDEEFRIPNNCAVRNRIPEMARFTGDGRGNLACEKNTFIKNPASGAFGGLWWCDINGMPIWE